MFQNLSFSNLSFPREPVLWVAVLVALGQIVLGVLQDGVGVGEAVEAAIALVAGFVVRGQVTPVSAPKTSSGVPLAPVSVP